MERVPQLVRRGKKDRRMGAPSELDWEAIEALRTEMRVELIQELIPLGLAEVGRVLDEEVERLAGPEARPQGRRRSDLPAWEQPGLAEAAETARHEERGHGRTYRIEDRSTWQWQARGGLERLRSTRPSDAI